MKLFGRHIYRTMFGPAQVFEAHAPDGSEVRVLKVGGVFQSATYVDERRFEPVFEYYRAFDLALDDSARPSSEDAEAHQGGAETSEAGRPEASQANREASCRKPLEILMIGGGGCAWPKHVLASRPDVRIDVVEVDPAVIGIARKHFFVDEAMKRFDPEGARMRLLCSDARGLLESASGRGRQAPSEAADGTLTAADAGSLRDSYDVIVNDAFSGMEPVRSLATVEAAQLMKRRLAPDGLYLANIVSEEGGDLEFLRDSTATLLEAFEHVHIVPCPDEDFGGEDNYLVIATDGPRRFENAVPFDESFPGIAMRD